MHLSALYFNPCTLPAVFENWSRRGYREPFLWFVFCAYTIVVRYAIVKMRYDTNVDMSEHAHGWGMQNPRQEKYIVLITISEDKFCLGGPSECSTEIDRNQKRCVT